MGLDFGLFGSRNPYNQQVYRGSGGNWFIWSRPKGCTMFHAVLVGSGAGGGGGHSAASGVARGGGGGGGSGGIVNVCGPLMLLPDRLFVNPGKGGGGGAATVDGTAGTMSYISIKQGSTTAADVVAQSGATVAAFGAKGTNLTGGAGGAAEVIAVNTTSILGGAFLWTARVGAIGSNGGAQTGADGTAVTALTIAQTTGGAGGGGVGTNDSDFSGGAITAAGMIPAIAGGVVAGGVGQGGWNQMNPFLSSGGTGGGTNGASGTGGRGGPGGFGSGGAGGGGGVTGGAGGPGGPGLIIITCW